MDYKDFFSINKENPEISDYVQAMNKLCKEYGQEIIASHHALGNPVYYEDPAFPNLIVKEMSDGSKYLIKPLANREDQVIRKL